MPTHLWKSEPFTSRMDSPLENIFWAQRSFPVFTSEHQILGHNIRSFEANKQLFQCFAHWNLAKAAPGFWRTEVTVVHGFAHVDQLLFEINGAPTQSE